MGQILALFYVIKIYKHINVSIIISTFMMDYDLFIFEQTIQECIYNINCRHAATPSEDK